MALLQPRKKAAVLKIIIIGCGKVGYTLADQLSSEGHDIMIVDTNEALLRSVSESLDVMTVCGNGACLHVLEDAGLADADMVVAVTGSDELNLLCCIIARKAGGSIAVIARVRNPDYNDELIYLRQKLGLSLVINPEMEAAREISRIIARPQALTVSAFSKAQVELVRFQLPANNVLCGKSVKDMGELLHFGFLACAVERGGQVTIPDGSFVFQAGDELSVLASRRDVHRVFDSIGMHVEAARNCMMIGGGKSTYYLARMLLEQHVNVRIIEADAGRCAELSRLLPEATIIHGDGTDEDLLSEEGIQSMDAFVPLTGMDEENILLTLYAKRIPGIKTITKVNRITFKDVLEGLDLGSVVYPKYITAEAIIAYVRARQNSIGSNVETLYHMFDNRVEAIEFHIGQEAPVIGVPLNRLKKKDHLLIACIGRDGRIIFPRGHDSMQPNDHVIIITTHKGLSDIADILKP